MLAIGAVDEHYGKWNRAGYSNHGPWVDATARGSNLQSTFASAKTKVALGATTSPFDPTIAFKGWAAWDGTSFATPIAAAMIARTMSRNGLTVARDRADAAAGDGAGGAAARLPERRPARRDGRQARALVSSWRG